MTGALRCRRHPLRAPAPELGIASEKRKILATQAAVDALFAAYERDWLLQQGLALAKLRAWLDAGERGWR